MDTVDTTNTKNKAKAFIESIPKKQVEIEGQPKKADVNKKNLRIFSGPEIWPEIWPSGFYLEPQI